MKRIALGTAVLLALAAPAQAQTMTCEMLRYYASIYPRSVLEHYAKLYQANPLCETMEDRPLQRMRVPSASGSVRRVGFVPARPPASGFARYRP